MFIYLTLSDFSLNMPKIAYKKFSYLFHIFFGLMWNYS